VVRKADEVRGVAAGSVALVMIGAFVLFDKLKELLQKPSE
jgi:hypothetical protein